VRRRLLLLVLLLLLLLLLGMKAAQGLLPAVDADACMGSGWRRPAGLHHVGVALLGPGLLPVYSLQ
jgi:hypothetical protein